MDKQKMKVLEAKVKERLSKLPPEKRELVMKIVAEAMANKAKKVQQAKKRLIAAVKADS